MGQEHDAQGGEREDGRLKMGEGRGEIEDGRWKIGTGGKHEYEI